MSIADLLKRERVLTDVTARSRKHALDLASEALARDLPTVTQADVFCALMNRERLGSTGLGKGVALPHGRIAGLDRSVAAFVRLDEAVDYEAIDHQSVDIIFAILVPEQCSDEHLSILAELARFFSDAGLCDRLRSAPDADAVYDILTAGPEPHRATA